MALDEVRPGQRKTAASYNEVLREIRASRVLTGGGGSTVIRGQSGLHVSPAIEDVQAIFVTEINPDDPEGKTLAGRIARWNATNGEWDLWYEAANPDKWKIRGRPWPGWLLADFEPYLLADETTVVEGDRACNLMPGDFFALPGGGGGAVGQIQGKIIHVNLETQMALVAPLRQSAAGNFDPTSIQWNDTTTFFDVEHPICAWIGGFTGVCAKQPAVLFYGISPIPWVMTWRNITGPELERWCRPQGLLSPVPFIDCEAYQGEPLCVEGICCKEGEPCRIVDEAWKCNTADGWTFYDAYTSCDCSDPEQMPPECCGEEPVSACCLPDGQCQMVTEAECTGLTGIWHEGVNCNEEPCDPRGACCYADVECQVTTEGICRDKLDGIWHEGLTCEEAGCVPGEPLGACGWEADEHCYCLGEGMTEAECMAQCMPGDVCAWFEGCSCGEMPSTVPCQCGRIASYAPADARTT